MSVDQFLTAFPHSEAGHAQVVAVDGRSGSGKSTLTRKLQRALNCAVVHTDDVAWCFSKDEATAFWDQWAADEIPFLEDQRPWTRADFIVAGTGSASTDSDQVIVHA